MSDLLEKYRSTICAGTAPVVRDPRLLMDEEGDVRIYYAPFEYLNPDARVVLVGISPGPTQMVSAVNEARRVLLSGGTGIEALRSAKGVGGFSGEPMRSNLVKQLNHWGFQRWLGLQNSSELFSSARRLLQTTSLLRYPVFVNDDDYRGKPDMTRHTLLRRHLNDYFVEDVKRLPDAVFVGLGPVVQQVLEKLVGDRVLEAERVIGGMLHPSGNCTYRIKYLAGDRAGPIPHATNPQPYDDGRRAFELHHLRLGPIAVR